MIGRWTWLTAIRSVGMIDTPAVSLSGWPSSLCVAVTGAALVGAVPGLDGHRGDVRPTGCGPSDGVG